MKSYKFPTDQRGKVIRNLLESNKGSIFSVKFTKQNGELRTLTGRLGVTKDLKGGVSGTAQHEKYLNVYDVQKQAYRSVNVETVQEIRMKNTTCSFS